MPKTPGGVVAEDRAVESTPPRRTRGFGAVLVAVYALFALAAFSRSLVQTIRDFDEAPLAYSLSAVAALTYILATVLVARADRHSRTPAVALCSLEFLGVVVVGTLSIADPALFPDATVWSDYGIGYGFVPLILPLVALAWLLRGARRGPRSADQAPTSR